MVKDKCKKCGVAALYSIFYKERPDPAHPYHINTPKKERHPRPELQVCRKCALQFDDDDGNIIGVLDKASSAHYMENVSIDSKYQKYCNHGCIVLESNTVITSAFLSIPCPKLKVFKRLVHNLHMEGEDKTDTFRLWAPLLDIPNSREREGNRKGVNQNEVDRKINNVLLSLERTLAPHEYYASMAKNQLSVLKEESKVCAIPVFHVEKFNVFVRGPQSETPQTLHIDSPRVKFVFIAPVKTSGYTFRYIPGSHKHLSNVDLSIPVDYAKVETITVEQGQIICFVDSLIHSGGVASRATLSHPLDEQFRGVFGWKYPALCPSDISYQLTVLHRGLMEASYYIGNPIYANVLPFKKIATTSEQRDNFHKYLEDDDNNLFESDVCHAKDAYFDLLYSRTRSKRFKRRPKPVNNGDAF